VLAALKSPTQLDAIKQTASTPFDPVHKRTLATVVDGVGATRH
jgi:H+-transporting ATPase